MNSSVFFFLHTQRETIFVGQFIVEKNVLFKGSVFKIFRVEISINVKTKINVTLI